MAKRRRLHHIHKRRNVTNRRNHLSTFRRRLTLEALEERRLLAVVMVTTELDTVDFNDGQTSLREAIFATNLVDGPDTIRFDFGHDGPATILLAQGELAITDDLTIEGSGADLLTIDASGNDPTPDLDNGDGSRVFNVDDGSLETRVDVAFFGVTLTGGDAGSRGGAIYAQENLRLEDVVIVGNCAAGSGGGLNVRIRDPFLPVADPGPGQLEIVDCVISGNTARGGRAAGGGIYAVIDRGGTMTIRGAILTGNQSESGGGGAFVSMARDSRLGIEDVAFSHNIALGDGGGIYVYSSGGEATIRRALIHGNQADNNGAGIATFGRGGALEIIESTISDNTAAYDGGGALLNRSNSTILRSTISGNVAGRNGGGVFGRGGVIVDSTIADNSAQSGGGAWLQESQVVQSTVSGNSADFGGGIGGRFIRINHSTIAMNIAQMAGGGLFGLEGTVDVSHSIVAANNSAAGPDITGLLETSLSLVNSLVGTNAGSGLEQSPVDSPDENGNLIGGRLRNSVIDPRLGPLADNGGPTMTHALLPDSPAINAGDPSAIAGAEGVPFHDQRGAPFSRVFGGRIDIGAVEAIPRGFLAGDFSRDGMVDAMDYTYWRNQFGSSVDPASGADGNGDGVIDARDYYLWKRHFGLTQDDLGGWRSLPPERIASAGESPRTVAARSAYVAPVAVATMAAEGRLRQIIPTGGEEVREPIGRVIESIGAAMTIGTQGENALIAWISARRPNDDAHRASVGDDRQIAPDDSASATADDALESLTDSIDRVLERIGADG